MVVMMLKVTGLAISRAPFIAACMWFMPFCRNS